MNLIAAALSALVMLSAGGPSDDLFDTLKAAPSEEIAEQTADDIRAGWMESGSPTADILLERGLYAMDAGDDETARDFFDRAILVKPDFAEAYVRRAGVFIRGNAFDETIRDLDEALRLEPRHFAAWIGLGQVFTQLGALDQAAEAYGQALEIYPLHPAVTQEMRRLKPLLEGRAI